jgi:hypothetical protein
MKIEEEKGKVRITGVNKWGDAKCITVYQESYQSDSTFRSNVDAAIEEVMNHENY